jgi:hypothetical protein
LLQIVLPHNALELVLADDITAAFEFRFDLPPAVARVVEEDVLDAPLPGEVIGLIADARLVPRPRGEADCLKEPVKRFRCLFVVVNELVFLFLR